MREEKRQPLLADLFVQNKPSVGNALSPVQYAHVQQQVRRAQRFVFDDKAAIRLGEIARDIPDLILREQRFARAPYDIMWVEMPFPIYWETITGQKADSDTDQVVGYLFDHDSVYVVSGDPQTSRIRPALVPVTYHLHQPWSLRAQLAFCSKVRTSRMQLDAFLWGEAVHKLGRDQKTRLRAAHSCSLHEVDRHSAERIFYDVLLKGSSGDLRTIITTLLLMNRPALTHYVRELNHSRGFIGNKVRPYMAHRVVTIHVDPIPVLRAMSKPEGLSQPRRRHEVRGHWCHDQTYWRGSRIGCIHEWVQENEDDPLSPGRYQCKLCKGRRWWRRAHQRGDAGIGYADKSYEVTN